MQAESIQNRRTNVPLSPIVALGLFFTELKLLVLEHSKGNDQTVQLLYYIAQRVSKTVAAHENTTNDDLLSFCQMTES